MAETKKKSAVDIILLSTHVFFLQFFFMIQQKERQNWVLYCGLVYKQDSLGFHLHTHITIIFSALYLLKSVIKTEWLQKILRTFEHKNHFYVINTSYLTDFYISFTLNLESRQIFCFNRLIRSSTYGKRNISDFPPCGKMVIFVTEFVIFLLSMK